MINTMMVKILCLPFLKQLVDFRKQTGNIPWAFQDYLWKISLINNPLILPQMHKISSLPLCLCGKKKDSFSVYWYHQ